MNIDTIKKLICDEFGTLYSDQLILKFVEDGKRDYLMQTGRHIVQFDYAVVDGFVMLPSDCVEISRVDDITNGKSLNLNIYSWKHLHNLYPDLREIRGDALTGAIVDLYDRSKLRLFPLCETGRVRVYYKSIKDDDEKYIDEDAIRYYCMFLIGLATDKGNAVMWHNKYIERINDYKKNHSSFNTRRNAVARYF